MANIKTHLDKIKNALFGQEVRGSIHDGIDAINKEVEGTTEKQNKLGEQFKNLVINEGNSNAEVAASRGSHDWLPDRLDNFDSQLEQNMTKVNEQFNTITHTLDKKVSLEIDDTPRLNRLLEKIKNTGGEISLDQGEYVISSSLNLPAYTKFKCNGDVIIKNNGNFDTLINVGYGCDLGNLTLKVNSDFKGVVCSLNSQYIYSSMVNVQNHSYANARIRLSDLLIVCDSTNPYATGIEVNSNGSTTPFVSECGLYCLSFDNIGITGYFKKGINIKCEKDVNNAWVHNLFFDNINFKQCQTDISINDGGYCSFFNNIISQPVQNYSKKFIELINTSSIIFNNVQYWDIQLAESSKVVDINNSSKIKFINTSLAKENLNITNVSSELLYSIELDNFIYPYMYNNNLNFTRCCKIGRVTPYYDKLFFVKIPLGGKASINFDITGGTGDGISEKVFANYSLTFTEESKIIKVSNSDINVIDSTAKFDKNFYINTQTSDDKFVYGYVYAKTNSQSSGYNTIFIKNRNNQMYDANFLVSNTYGYVVPLELETVESLPASSTIITFPDKNLTNLFVKKETRVVNLNQGQTNINDFLSDSKHDIKMFDVNIKNAVLWNTTDTIINIEKTNDSYRANLKVFSNKAIENVTIEVTALVTKK